MHAPLKVPTSAEELKSALKKELDRSKNTFESILSLSAEKTNFESVVRALDASDFLDARFIQTAYLYENV